MIEYKKLPLELKRKGIYYKQEWRDENFSIYGMGSFKESFLGYECFEIPKHDGYEIAGNRIVPTEYFPKDENFGSLAFHCATLERAQLRLQQLRDMKRLREKS